MVLGNECEDSLRALLAKNVNNSPTNKNNNLFKPLTLGSVAWLVSESTQ